jgi:hypothetical protein
MADDYKLYPGSYCRTSVSDNVSVFSDAYGSGAIANLDFQRYLTVRCPIIRDYMAEDSGVRQVRVWFQNTNPDWPVLCTVSTRLPDGRVFMSKTARSESGARQGSFTVDYGGNAGVFTIPTLTCFLPPTLENFRFPRISAFQVEEFG